MQSRPNHFEQAKLVYVQLHLCLKTLDALGLDLPAVHLDASITALRKQIEGSAEWLSLGLSHQKDFTEMDKLISRTFLPTRVAR